MEGGQIATGSALMADGDTMSDSTNSDLTQPVQVIPDLDMTPLVEGAHGMNTFDAAQLTNIVDIDGNVHISSMIDDSDSTSTIASIVKSDSSSHHAISGIHHLDAQSSHHISSLVDTDSANLASIVTSDDGHLTTLTSGHHISMLNSVDSVTISEMVSSSAAGHLSIISDSNNPVDGIALVSADDGSVGEGLSGEVSQFGDEHCVPGMSKTHLSCDEEGSEPNLENDKITLHMTTDQEIGMARLENKVSIL